VCVEPSAEVVLHAGPCGASEGYAAAVSERLPAEERMAEVIAAYPPEVRAILLKVLTNRDQTQRARWIGELYADERARGFAELLIDLEEDPAARAFVVGVLREADR